MITVRRAVGWAAVAGTLPYLGLKAAWLSGSRVGILDSAAFEGPSVFVLNAITAGMDLVAIIVALLFTYSWAVPGFLVLVPIWVGTGFLVPIAVLLPGMDFGEQQSFLEPWVQPLVYGGFAFQGVMLVAAFVFYARERWGFVFRIGMPEIGTARVVAAHVGALLAAASGVRFIADDSVVFGGFAFVAASATVVIAHRVRGPLWVPLVVAWLGSGALFAWGAWSTVVLLSGTFLDDGAPAWPSLLDVAAGALIAVSVCAVRPPCTAASAPRPRTRGGTSARSSRTPAHPPSA
jgi:hypothetical protein